MAKRARELAVKEKRERKRAKKAERAAGLLAPAESLNGEHDSIAPPDDEQTNEQKDEQTAEQA